MAHNISGIITSFKYEGDLPHLYLVGNYALLPLDAYMDGYKGFPEKPFEELTPPIIKLAKELSWRGKVAFIETSYFGGDGSQASLVWESGRRVLGPLYSSTDEISGEYSDIAEVVEVAINLRFAGCA
jgi:hypothetical protein